MNTKTCCTAASLFALALLVGGLPLAAEEPAAAPPQAIINGQGPHWQDLTLADFDNFNGDEDTWSEAEGVIHCTGRPTGVARSKKQYGNFELVAQWRHLKSGGNSGFFVWAPEGAFTGIKPGQLPRGGIEVQVLDHGYKEQYERGGRKADWFTTNGDVFPVGSSKMKPFPPVAPNGSRSFPSKDLSRGTPEWNHYYIRAINGEVRLWVNGEEVSGGAECQPAAGYLCLEAEGAPIDFKAMRIRELP
ncbi:MAG: DUF1080 domain-containing protein [Planctomycetales bacterium]|nr:DUF1080 domain-containing protein [Planctomycetales bacterium]